MKVELSMLYRPFVFRRTRCDVLAHNHVLKSDWAAIFLQRRTSLCVTLDQTQFQYAKGRARQTSTVSSRG